MLDDKSKLKTLITDFIDFTDRTFASLNPL